jgi:hypothetical protein
VANLLSTGIKAGTSRDPSLVVIADVFSVSCSVVFLVLNHQPDNASVIPATRNLLAPGRPPLTLSTFYETAE